MRAVNLMPGTGSGPKRARERPLGAYILIAGLAGLVAFAALWTMATRDISSNNAKAATVNAEAAVAEARAAAAAPYEAFAKLARDRVQTVASLSATRFDWANGLRDVARILPSDVWFVAMTGTSGASAGPVGPTSSAAPAPRIELQGCTRSQSDVARLMTRLRAVNNVRSVDLSSSTKPDSADNDQCPANRTSDPTFTVSIRFAVPGEGKAAVDTTGQVKESAPAATNASAPASGTSTSTPSGKG
jgi:Tfp pilus assembly protein PilN